MKIFKIALVILAVLLITVTVVITFQAQRIVKTAVTNIGPKIMGVPVKLDNVQISLLRGRVILSNLAIGNPAGFKTDHSFKLDRFLIEFVPRSLLSKRIIIRNITIDSPDIMYEQTLSGNNFGKIGENLKGAQSNKQAKETAKSGQTLETKIEIDKILINTGMIHVTMPGMASSAVPIPLPPVQLTDIGKDQGGASVEDVINQVFSAIFDVITKAVLASGDVIGKGVEGIGKGAVEGTQAAGEAAKDTGKEAADAAAKGLGEIKGLFGK